MARKIVNDKYDIVNPQKTSQIAVKTVGIWPCSIGEDISDAKSVNQVRDISGYRRAMILLMSRLAFPVKQHYIMRLRLKEIVSIFR